MSVNRKVLDNRLSQFKEKTSEEVAKPPPTRSNSTSSRSQSTAVRTFTKPRTLSDISLEVGERGLILGMTRVGKSTLAAVLIEYWTNKYKKARTIILDSKPRFRAQWQLNGLPAAPLYRNWDWGEVIPGSVVIPLRNPRAELKQAWKLGFRIVIAQIHTRSHIKKLDETLKVGYEDRKKGNPLFFYVDELNNFFRNGSPTGDGIVMVVTSGGEKSVAFLGAAQRPRWISVEAIESLTKLYWFYTPYFEDVKHLKAMGLPGTSLPPNKFYVFLFFDRLSNKYGYSTVIPTGREVRKNAKVGNSSKSR